MIRKLLILSSFTIALIEVGLAETPLHLGPFRDVTITGEKDGTTEIVITGTTPHFWTPPVLPPKNDTILSFDYFSPSGIDSISVRFRNEAGEMVFANSKPLPLAETWQPFAIELPLMPTSETRLHLSLKDKPNSGFHLRNLRLREPNQAEIDERKNRDLITAAREADANTFLDYLRNWYPARIDTVEVGRETIRISASSPTPIRLVELPAHTPSHKKSSLPSHTITDHNAFHIELPRIDEETLRDRALSRWRLETPEGDIASLAKWPTSIAPSPSGAALPKQKAPSLKGIGGVPTIRNDDHPIFELGVHHATVNFVLNSLLSPKKSQGLQPWTFEGTTYYLNESFLSGKDATIRALCKQDILVTCILLVGNSERSELKHPEAEPRGKFAMPDLATAEGAHCYRAAIALLTERYSKPNARISNWVIHNEIDQHGTWTNMGDQPLARYLETYARSARIVYHSARLHDPHARVFISLTHHWTKPSIGKGAFVVRELLDLWSEIASAEGEFDWGVAYHPYPQDLRNPDTWNDRDVTSGFDTLYITPKNIEVLPAYLGPDRPILLSEQGFNTPTLSLADQKRQSAGLIYMFRKLRNLPTIEAYHLHRYQDMPDREGGLRLGILDENGNRKLGWDTYTAIGTKEEATHAAAADKLLPATPKAEPSTEAPKHRGTAAHSTSSGQAPRPNIILIVADDLGWSDTTPYLDPGEDFYETPALAALAERGMKFTNAYSASPLCSPTRASILTGQYPGRIRLTTPAAHLPKVVLDPIVPQSSSPANHAVEPQTRTRFPNTYVTIAERLKSRNFATAFVGKWHLGHPPYIPDNQGFDLVIGGREHPGPPGGFFAPWPIDTIPSAPEGSHIDDIITDETIAWLEDQNSAGNPFFLNLWYYSVHAPFEAKPDLIEKYRAKAKRLPPDAPRANPVMAAMIETLDTNVGRIITTIDRLGIAENTLLIFTSDNGGNEYNYVEGLLATNNHPLRNGKGNIAEGGQRVPFIAVWPGNIQPGSQNAGLVSSIDLFPTILDAVSQSPAPAQPVDGISLIPAFLGETPIDPDRTIYCHFPHSPPATGTIGGTSIRRGPWKLTRFFADDPEQADRLRLINLEIDPGESKDLSATHPELTATLNELITTHLAETASLVSQPNPNYRPSFLGWTAKKDVELSRLDDALLVEATGTDPSITTSGFPRTKGKISLEIEMDHPPSASPPVLYWSTKSAKNFHGDRSQGLEEIAPGHFRLDLDLEDETLNSLRLDPARQPGRFIIHSIRLIQWTAPGAGKTQRLWDF